MTSDTNEAPVRVGLVGAGPWAQTFTAPMLAKSPAVELTGIWARRPEAAQALAAQSGSRAAASLDELLEGCEAVAFAVPPDVQPELASRAAEAGRAVLLEKPIGLTVEQAEALVDAIEGAGVISQVVLTNRYLPELRELLEWAPSVEPHGAHVSFMGSGVVEGGLFATPWRLEHGVVPDLGPHVLDALDAVLGPVVDVQAAGDPHGVVALLCTHDRGLVSSALLSLTSPGEPSGLVVEVYGRAGRLRFVAGWDDPVEGPRLVAAVQQQIAGELAAAVRSGRPHPLDARRGLHLQHLVDQAGRSLAEHRPPRA